MPWKAAGTALPPHRPGRHSRATNGQVASETPLANPSWCAGLLVSGLRPLTKFVSGLSLEPEGQGQRRSGEDEGLTAVEELAWGFPICVTRSNEFGWAGDLQRMRFRRLRSCKHDTMEFVAFALGYPRKFDLGRCATGASGWQTVAAAGCGLAAGFLASALYARQGGWRMRGPR